MTTTYEEAVASFEARPDYQNLSALDQMIVSAQLDGKLRKAGYEPVPDPNARPKFKPVPGGGDIADQLNAFLAAQNNPPPRQTYADTLEEDFARAIAMVEGDLAEAVQRTDEVREAESAHSIAPTGVEWLWPGRLARGKLTITDGNPGIGKSARQVDTAATLSTGRDWPDNVPNGLGPVNVGIVSAEDDWADTIVPRLLVARADMRRVFQFKGNLTIPDEMAEFEAWVKRNRLVWVGIDPLAAFVSDKHDLNHDQKTRRALAPFQALLERNRLSAEGLRHTNKLQNVTSALDKGSGSRAIGGASRVNLFVARNPKDTDEVVIATVKGNLSVEPPSLTYRIGSASLEVKHPGTGEPMTGSYPVIQWTGRSTLTADELLVVTREPNKTEAAVAFLQTALAAGPVDVIDIENRAASLGISVEGALKVARKRMTDNGILVHSRRGMNGAHYLALRGVRADDEDEGS